MPGQPGHNATACPIATQFTGHGDMDDDLETDHSFDSQAMRVIDMFGLIYWHVIGGRFYNQTSDWLVQELNVCTVHQSQIYEIQHENGIFSLTLQFHLK